jgi:uncharacterized protein HemX
MCNPLLALAISAGVGAATSGISAAKQGAAQKKAFRAQEKAATLAKEQQRRVNEKANMPRPDTASFLSRAQEMAQRGFAGTLLSGSKGVSPASLAPLIGRSSLLGG